MFATLSNPHLRALLEANLEQKKMNDFSLRFNKQALSELLKIHGEGNEFWQVGGIHHLILYNSEVQELKMFQRLAFPSLTSVELHINRLASLEDLKLVCSKTVKFMDLSMNRLKSLQGLQLCKCHELKLLVLSNGSISREKNQLEDVGALSQCNFPQLKELILASNHISELKGFERLQFRQLLYLDLASNKIVSIEALPRAELTQLQRLSLSSNLLCRSRSLRKCCFPQMKNVDLSGNPISDWKGIEEMSQRQGKIQNFQLSFTLVSDIRPLVKFIRPWNIAHKAFAPLFQCTEVVENSTVELAFKEVS